jgi:hypothetical protein
MLTSHRFGSGMKPENGGSGKGSGLVEAGCPRIVAETLQRGVAASLANVVR